MSKKTESEVRYMCLENTSPKLLARFALVAKYLNRFASTYTKI